MKKRRRKKRIKPEPGTWVNDEIKGMPKLHPPDDVPKSRITASQLREYIEYEGLGFCIYQYIPAERILNKRLAILWRKARIALAKIVDYLEENQRRGWNMAHIQLTKQELEEYVGAEILKIVGPEQQKELLVAAIKEVATSYSTKHAVEDVVKAAMVKASKILIEDPHIQNQIIDAVRKQISELKFMTSWKWRIFLPVTEREYDEKEKKVTSVSLG